MIALKDYAQTKNKYCICYFGPSDEYLVQMRLIQPHLEKAFHGLSFHLGCRKDKTQFLNGQQSFTLDQIKVERRNFGYVREVKFNGETHPIEDLVIEAGILDCVVNSQSETKTQKAVIITKGSHPTKPMLENQLKKIKNMISSIYGMNYEVDTNIDNAGLVVGVESVELFESAAQGIKTILIPTGRGARLYKMMFPNGEVMHI